MSKLCGLESVQLVFYKDFRWWASPLYIRCFIKYIHFIQCMFIILQLPSMHEKLSIMEREHTVSEEMEKILLNDLLESFGKLSVSWMYAKYCYFMPGYNLFANLYMHSSVATILLKVYHDNILVG